jgi:hypothetical protein
VGDREDPDHLTARAAAEAAGGDWRLVFVLFSAADLDAYRAAL